MIFHDDACYSWQVTGTQNCISLILKKTLDLMLSVSSIFSSNLLYCNHTQLEKKHHITVKPGIAGTGTVSLLTSCVATV